MPNHHTSQNSREKPAKRASEGASKMKSGAQEIASVTSAVVVDKARQVRDQVDSSPGATQGKVKSLANEAGSAVKQTTDQAASAASGVVSGAKEVLSDVAHEANALLHDAQDAAVDSYDAARDYAVDVAHEASELAQRAGEGTVRYVRRASTATGKFAGAHTLPLIALGASLGWLAWSVRSSRRREPNRLPRPRATMEARRAPVSESRELRPSPTAPTTSGARLMGVRP